MISRDASSQSQIIWNLTEAAGLGHRETDWKTEVKAMLLLGSEEFVDRMKRDPSIREAIASGQETRRPSKPRLKNVAR